MDETQPEEHSETFLTNTSVEGSTLIEKSVTDQLEEKTIDNSIIENGDNISFENEIKSDISKITIHDHQKEMINEIIETTKGDELPNDGAQEEETIPDDAESKKEEDDTPKYTEEELDIAYMEFIKRKTLPPYLMRPFVLNYARGLVLKSLMIEDYDEAAKKEKIVTDLHNGLMDDQGGADPETRIRIIEQRLLQAQELKKSTIEKWKKEIIKTKEEEKVKIDKLIADQLDEQENFQKFLQGPEYLSKFSKPSKELLHLRKTQKSLALAHDFESAKRVKQAADDLQHKETDKARKHAVESVKLNYQQLLDKQERILECARQNSDRKIFDKEFEMEKEIEAINKLIGQLHDKFKYPRIQQLSNLPPLNPKMAIPSTVNRQISKFRRSNVSNRLDVRINNIMNVLPKKAPPTSKSSLAKTV